jgi:hypothetical protein
MTFEISPPSSAKRRRKSRRGKSQTPRATCFPTHTAEQSSASFRSPIRLPWPSRRCRPAEAETVALYVADLKRRGRRPATIPRKLAAIAVYHRSTDHPTPTDHDVVRAVVRGTRRKLGVAQPQKTALELDSYCTSL